MSWPVVNKVRVENTRPANHNDNSDTNMVADKQGSLLVSHLNLPLTQMALRGNLFHGMSIAAGHVLPVASTTTPTYAIWNPSDSGVNMVPVCFRFGTITLGTRAVSSLVFNLITGLGNAIGTGTACTAFASTPTAIKSASFGVGSASKMLFSNAGTVTVTATTTFFTTGQNHDLATTGQTYDGEFDFRGELIVAPGTMIFPAFQAAASGSTYVCQMSWYEIPTITG